MNCDIDNLQEFAIVLADELDSMPRSGRDIDQPEGTRIVIFSDTLMKRIADCLRVLARGELAS